MATTYITTKDANVYTYSGLMSFPSASAINIIPKGTIIDVVDTASGGIGIIATNFLVLKDGTYIVASDANVYSENMPQVLQDFSLRNGILITIAIVAGIYLASKYQKNKN